MLAATPPVKKRKISEHGESPQLTPDMKNGDGAHWTDVEEDVFEQEHGSVLKRKFGQEHGPVGTGRGNPKRKYSLPKISRHQRPECSSIEQRLKKWGMAQEFTVRGGSAVGCIACMKYAAWCDQEEADAKKVQKKKKQAKKEKLRGENKIKIKKKKKEEKEKPLGEEGDEDGEAEADSIEAEGGGEEETTPADIQHALRQGTYIPKKKYPLQRHLSGSQHKKAVAAREAEENEHASMLGSDVPSDAQMTFVYEDVKKNPMVPPLPPLPWGYSGYYGLIITKIAMP